MPYINLKARQALNPIIIELAKLTVVNQGKVNYTITKLCHRILLTQGLNYSNINALIGVLECAKLELYRMVAAKYGDKKRLENGGVSELDTKTLEDVR